MKNNLQIFTNENFGSIRALKINGKPWFVGRDIATALGYSNTKDALKAHVEEEDKRILQRSEITTLENHSPGAAIPANFTKADIPNRGLTIINESGMYALIFGSKLESAKEFKHWVTDEVLPSIRETGQYSLNDSKPDSYMIEDPIARAQRWIEEQKEKKELEAKTIELTETNQKLEKERDELIPKAEFGGMIGISNDCITMEEMAKVLHSHGIKDIGRNRLFAWLRAEKVLQRNNLPYQRYLESGFFKVHEYTYADRKTGEPRIGTKTTVTPKGQMAIVHSWVTWLRRETLEEVKIQECN